MSEPIRYAGEGHALCVGPSGTGKTSGPAICNMLLHPGAAICLDPKGMIFQATATSRRAMGHAVHVLDLRDGRASDALNPMDLAVMAASEPSVAGRIMATSLVARGVDERDPYWADASETLLASLFAELIKTDKLGPRTIATIHALLNHEDVMQELARRMDKRHFTISATRGAIGSFLNLPDTTTRPCVLSTTQQHLRLWDIELVRRVTASTTIDLAALIAGGPVTLYIVVPPTQLHAMAPLLRLWFGGLLAALSLRPGPPRHKTLVLVDEAATLGRFEPLVTAATLLRSWGVQLFTMWQSMSQLDIYREQARTLIDNAGVIQILGIRNARMAREFSDLVGGISEEVLLNLQPSQQVLAIEGSRPFVSEHVRFYSDPLFAGHAKLTSTINR